MNPAVMFIAASILLLAVGLMTWSGLITAQVEDDLRAFSGFEGQHFDV